MDLLRKDPSRCLSFLVNANCQKITYSQSDGVDFSSLETKVGKCCGREVDVDEMSGASISPSVRACRTSMPLVGFILAVGQGIA